MTGDNIDSFHCQSKCVLYAEGGGAFIVPSRILATLHTWTCVVCWVGGGGAPRQGAIFTPPSTGNLVIPASWQ